MDVCPEGEVSIALVDLHSARADTRFFTVEVSDPDETAREILETLK